MFFKKKIQQVKEFFNWGAFASSKDSVSISEPKTLAQIRLQQGAKDIGADKGVRLYNSHQVKIKNQWINPLTSINTGFGSAQFAYYNYQDVNYWECYALAQDPLFNKIFNILSRTPFANDGMVSDDLSETERENLQKGLLAFKVKENLEKAERSAFVAGGCLIYMDFGIETLEEPLDLEKVNMKDFKGFRRIDPINVTPVDVNTTQPADADYMNPKKWYVIGLGVCDRSHFLKFEENEPESVMKPMCLYFGMPLTQLIKQDIANSNMASQGLANLMNRFRNLYLKTDRSNFVGEGAQNFKTRLEVMSLFQDNHSIYPLENTEDIMQFVTPVTGMSDACEFFYQIIASKTDITLSILLGKGAQGLSGTLEGERKNFYDRIRTIQSRVKPNLLKMYGIVYGYMTDGKFKTFLDYNFNPLEQSSEKEKAENLTRYVDVADKFLNMGVPSNEVMDWLKTHKDLNLENMDIEEQTETYGNDEDIEYDIEQANKSFNSKEDKIAYVMREFAAGKLKDSHGNIVTDKKQALAIAYSESEKKISNAQFDESEHPRDEKGKFAFKEKVTEEELEEDLAEFDKILDSFAEENKEYYNKKGKFEDAKKIQKKYHNYFRYNIEDASNPRGIHDPFYFEYDGKKDITNMWTPKKLEKNSSIIFYRGAEQVFVPVSEFDENKFKKLGFKRQKVFDEGLRDIYTENKEEKSDNLRDFERIDSKI